MHFWSQDMKFLSIYARQFSYSIVCVVLFGLCNYKSLKPLKGDHGRNWILATYWIWIEWIKYVRKQI